MTTTPDELPGELVRYLRPVYDHFHREVHQTLKTTPAMAAGVADHVWTLDEIVGLLD